MCHQYANNKFNWWLAGGTANKKDCGGSQNAPEQLSINHENLNVCVCVCFSFFVFRMRVRNADKIHRVLEGLRILLPTQRSLV